MSLEQNHFRSAMRFWTTGVSIVTTRYENRLHGMTVSSFTSISAEPPQVLVSLAKSSLTHEMVRKSGIIGITILSDQQQPIAECFAGQECQEDQRFEGVDIFTLTSGAPLLTGGLAYFDCRVGASYEAGTNTIFIGEVLAVGDGSPGEPLLYHDRSYRRLESVQK